MSRTKKWTRSLGLGFLAALVMLASGDRGARTDANHGQDPLEILNLQIRANAIVVLDSSGSMQENLASNPMAGDDSHSKMYQAKSVLAKVMKDNERKVSFQFGQYTQPDGMTLPASTYTYPAGYPSPPRGTTVKNVERFLYTTDATAARAPSMAANQITFDLRSYAIAANATMRFTEGATNRNVVVTPTARRYNSGVELGNAIAAAMNAVATNRYSVTYTDLHQFSFARTSGGTAWTLRFSAMTSAADDTLRQQMNTSTANQAFAAGSNGPYTSGVGRGDIDLRRRTNMNYTVTEDPLVGPVTMYKAYARRFFNGQRIVVRQPGATPATNGNVVCSVTPDTGTIGSGFGTGLLSVPTDPLSLRRQPWIDVVRADATCTEYAAPAAQAQTARFYFASVPRGGQSGDTVTQNGYDDNFIPGYGEWRTWGANTTCGGFKNLVDLTDCTNNAQFALFDPYLQPEIPIDPNTGRILGYTEDASGDITAQPVVGGIRAAGNTPISQAIENVDGIWEGTLWPDISTYGASGPFPKTFLIFLTDGDDTCGTTTSQGSLTDEQRALRAALRAQRLFASVDTTNAARRVASSVTTFLVAFGQGVSADKSDWIAWGGSGMTRTVIGAGGLERWDDWPGATAAARAAAALAYKQTNCPNCQDALVASNAADLSRLLQIAIDQGQQVGTFSDQQSVTDSIFELSFVVGYDPRNPQNRYRASVPVLLQSIFVMPDFQGRLKAFRRGAATVVEEWDAGQKLKDRVLWGTGTNAGTSNGMSVGTGIYRYDALRGTGSDPVAGGARIKRRIYSTSRNGVFGVGVTQMLANSSPSRVQLWPPDTAIDPSPALTAGAFDDEMGLAGMSYADLQRFGACTSSVGTDLPAACVTAVPAPAHAIMEARQIILAYMAGAELVVSGTAAVREPAPSRALQFRARSWIMAESTLAAPAVVGPPPAELPGVHTDEYRFFVTGGRNAGVATNGIAKGFGLRDPDKDSTLDANDTRQALKPVMNVVYHAANDMLHAFRAGPCRDGSATNLCLDGATETGGEELWGFVPYDLLGNLPKLVLPQSRANHVYMMAAPVRFGQVFVPGNWNESATLGTGVQGAGLWRNILLVGRGIGGKSYTGMDVTAPGPFTQGSLSTQPPLILWNRGNPDTQNGLVGGTANNTTADATAYAQMGETWSVPAMARVDPQFNQTTRSGVAGLEFVAYTGSGYSAVATEGKRFYVLDPLTGDVVSSTNVGNRAAGLEFENTIPSGPVVFNPLTLSNRDVAVNPAEVLATKVYFNDLHGRVFRVNTNSPGTVTTLADLNGSNTAVLQPFGVSPGLLYYGDAAGPQFPHVFVESGRENRIFSPEAAPPTTPPFRAWAIVDRDPAAATIQFAKDFPNLYRGTTQPATAFNASGLGRVLFGGTRFNPQGSTNAPPPYPCRSSFDSILFVLGAQTGNAAYDLNAGTGQDEYLEYKEDIIHSVQVVDSQVVVDHGLNAQIAPTPPPSNTIAPPVDANVFAGLSVPDRYTVSNRDVPFLVGSGVCR